MGSSHKTDNDNLASKLALRRHFLRKYHADQPPVVFDACQGSGVIWKKLRSEFAVARYWGVDRKKKPGRLVVESERIVCQPGFRADVVDVDTYGEPWAHYFGLLAHADYPVTVFVTIGMVKIGGGGVSDRILDSLGMTGLADKLPRCMINSNALHDFAVRSCLTRGCERITIKEIAESPRGKSARYIGIRLEPAETAATTPAAPSGKREPGRRRRKQQEPTP